MPLPPIDLLTAVGSPTTAAASAGLVVSPFLLLLLAIPVLLLGEQLVKRIGWLGRSNIPAPIAGGLLVALLIFAIQETTGGLTIASETNDVGWLWILLPQWGFAVPKMTGVERPLLILFFACIGLNASWGVAKRGGVALLIYLLLAAGLAVVQYATGIGTAFALGQDPLLGIMCSGVSLMGGFGTAAGFAPEFEKAGLHGASTIGIAAAAFGVIAGGLIAGPMAGRLMRKKVIGSVLQTGRSRAPVVPAGYDDIPSESLAPPMETAETLIDEGGFVDDLVNMHRHIGSVLVHVACLLVCLKLGAFLSAYAVEHGSLLVRRIPGVAADYNLAFPVYMGAMVVAVVVRNVHDLVDGTLIESQRTDLIASFALAWLLSVVMIGLKLMDLTTLATPMLAILLVQVAVMTAFSYWLVFRVMGRDYEATAMSAGMIGFGLGATSNAVATMRSLANRFGPAPRAFLIVTVVGAFLIDFVNAVLITGCLNFFKH